MDPPKSLRRPSEDLFDRLNPWVFGLGFILVIVGASFSLTYVIQGSVSSGSYTTISIGPILATVGAILMAMCYLTRRS